MARRGSRRRRRPERCCGSETAHIGPGQGGLPWSFSEGKESRGGAMWNKREEESVRPPTAAAPPPCWRRAPSLRVVTASRHRPVDLDRRRHHRRRGPHDPRQGQGQDRLAAARRHRRRVGQGRRRRPREGRECRRRGAWQPLRGRADPDPEVGDHARQPHGASRRARGRLLLPRQRRHGDSRRRAGRLPLRPRALQTRPCRRSPLESHVSPAGISGSGMATKPETPPVRP